MWVLFINLVFAALVRLVYRWFKAGIIITHVGLLLFFVAGFVTLHGVKESNITLMEGEMSNVSKAYHNWELSVWTQDGNKKQVTAIDADRFQAGQEVHLEKIGLSVTVKSYYQNCDAFGAISEEAGVLLNGSGIGSLKLTPYNRELEKNFPGGIFHLKGADFNDVDILLYGGESESLLIDKGEKTYNIMLRRKRSSLPFTIKLKDFMMERHPNTDMARSYKSLVEVITNGTSREALISMNEPLRHRNFTLYQASYSIDEFGRERSTLAVVKNSGRLLPYVATFVTFAGLAVHLLIMAFASKLKMRKKKK